MVESGQVLLPRVASWLDDFRRELLAFPSSKHDDQVDALAQLLDWARRSWAYQPAPSAGPILFIMNDDGSIESSGDDDWFDVGKDYNDEDPWDFY